MNPSRDRTFYNKSKDNKEKNECYSRVVDEEEEERKGENHIWDPIYLLRESILHEIIVRISFDKSHQ